VEVPGRGPLHVICVHLGLGESQRRHQVAMLAELLRDEVPADEPVAVAGDFNDWRRRADPGVRGCGLESAFAAVGDGCPRTFPARFPLLPLDRIYVRGLTVESACVLSAMPWPHLSDHLPLLAELSQ
jgi:endonuclease/exonuclease/phosphatase family metal-dependent hydrolase